MNKVSFEEWKEIVDNLMAIYVPKLKHVSESGNSSYIHKANNLLLVIDASYRNAMYYKDIPHIVTCREYLRTAEEWLENIAYK